jgi:chemotaxis protein CheY-P-specific phosphatase CheC
MGMPDEELAVLHTSDEVADVLGELMNQLVGHFTNQVRKDLQTHITQNQPKMLSLNKQVNLSVDTNLDRPQARRVTFSTEQGNIFYLELAMDKTEFIQLEEFDVAEDECPDTILEQTQLKMKASKEKKDASNESSNANDLLDELGI